MSPLFKTIKILLAIALICSSCGSRIPYTSFHTTFTLRGGTSTAADDFDSLSNHMHGIIDQRPEPAELDSVLLIQHNDIVQEALLNHTPYCDSENFDIDEEMAACSHTIGSICSTVYLLIEYDFIGGKTNLNRRFGGAKLLTFVDGVRSRKTAVATKLVLVLFPSSCDGGTDRLVIDLTNNTDWETSNGADYLVSRLREAFSLGGEDYQNIDPFDDVKVISISTDSNISEVVRQYMCSRDDSEIRAPVNTQTQHIEKFEQMIRNAYKRAGGSRNIDFK